MAEPAELLVIKDQYELARQALTRGLAAEEADKRDEALVCYEKSRVHLAQGVEVPTEGKRQQGPVWDTARELQQRMRNTLRTVDSHISILKTSSVTTAEQRASLLKGLPPDSSSIHHLYPTVPALAQDSTPAPHTPPERPPPPAAAAAAAAAAAHTESVPAAASEAPAMSDPGDQPPAYTRKPTDGHLSLGHGPAEAGPGSQKQAGGDGNELLFIPAGVQLFFVAQNGQVSSLSHPGYLRVFVFDGQQNDSAGERPTGFLHVCDWLYPLTVDTPVLLANSGIYMFPDTTMGVPGSYLGIVLSSELPAADRQMFQDLLSQLAELRIQDPEETGSEVINLSSKVPLGPQAKQTVLAAPADDQERPLLPGWSEKMGQGIISGATKLGESLLKGAEATGRVIQKGATKIRDHMTPEETPSEVSPHVNRSLQVAKQATDGAVRVSKYLVNGVSNVAERVADKVAPHVKKHGAKLIPESLKKKEDGRPSKMDGAKYVAASSVLGFTTVWSSMETGAKLVVKSVATETVTTVTYKYGDEAGRATDTALHSVANVGLTAYNIDNLGIKAFLKTAGKKTAKAMFKSSSGQPAKAEGEDGQKQEPPVQAAQMDADRKEPPAKTDGEDAQKKPDEEKKK
ncbi:spartin a [Salarias fasciatus]|uniref:MIT domain-containing protein n=1 Tax=Salarias fasciatus TaxID=181472 RepID=A0A672G7X8_SALFA|nr:spartin [Salarias fasciatus]